MFRVFLLTREPPFNLKTAEDIYVRFSSTGSFLQFLNKFRLFKELGLSSLAPRVSCK